MAEELLRRRPSRVCGRSPARASASPRARGRDDDRHLPQRPDALRRDADAGRAARRGARSVCPSAPWPGWAFGWAASRPGRRRASAAARSTTRAARRGTALRSPFERGAAARCRCAAVAGRRTPTWRRTTASARTSTRPMYGGRIVGIGPRYCPSIEDKVVTLRREGAHTIFLEPEAWDGSEIYVQGLSTQFPDEVQIAIPADGSRGWRTRDDAARLRGRVRLWSSRPAASALETHDRARPLPGRADQRNVRLRGGGGAGSRRGDQRRRAVRARSPSSCERSEAYAAVMIDDLMTKGLDEPYRLFTSRAEYRLLLGVDTVLPRLIAPRKALGLFDEASSTSDAGRRALRKSRGELAARRDSRPARSLERLDGGPRHQDRRPTTLQSIAKKWT